MNYRGVGKKSFFIFFARADGQSHAAADASPEPRARPVIPCFSGRRAEPRRARLLCARRVAAVERQSFARGRASDCKRQPVGVAAVERPKLKA